MNAFQKTCAECEYFDRHYGDCHNGYSPRFQTEAAWAACNAFFPDTSNDADAGEHSSPRQVVPPIRDEPKHLPKGTSHD